MNAIRYWLLSTLFVALPSLAAGESPDSQQDEPRFGKLPTPLDQISGNITDLEQTGRFAIVDAEFRTLGTGDEEAMVWTIRVNKPVTCRHVSMLLRKFRDVRFYKTPENSMQEVYSTMLYYSDRITQGAANRQILAQDDVFQVWVYLNRVTVRKLIGMEADTVVFRESKN